MNFFSVIKLLLGLSFFLFGMKVMSEDLEKFAGGKLESTLKRFTSNPILSMALGMVITIAVQSSSAVTVMLVGLVNSGIMQFSQTVFVLFGANIGTTLTAWILSLSGLESSNVALALLKPENFSPFLAFIGVMLAMFSKNDKKKNVGNIFVGFAVLMYGMVFMTEAVSPLAQLPGFTNVLLKFNNPLFGVFIGLVVTAAIQSSAASIGILQALSLTGSVSYGMAAPIVMGQNIGTCITSLLSCIGTTAKAKRVAALHTSIKAIGTVLCLAVFVAIDKLVSPALFSSAVTPWGVAAIHSIFNIATTVLLAPFSKLLIRMIEKLICEKELSDNTGSAFTLDERLLYTPSVAVRECDLHTARMARDAKEALIESFTLLFGYHELIAEKVVGLEGTTDQYEDGIGDYLSKMAALSLSAADSLKVTRMHHALGNFERMGDHAVNILEIAKDIDSEQIVFSEQAKNELMVLTEALTDILELTVSAYEEDNAEKAALVEPLEQAIDDITDEVKLRHSKRVSNDECTIELGFVLSDILNNFERISDHCSNVAVAVIDAQKGNFDSHSYLNEIKTGDKAFEQAFAGYKKKYLLP